MFLSFTRYNKWNFLITYVILTSDNIVSLSDDKAEGDEDLLQVGRQGRLVLHRRQLQAALRRR